MTTTERADYEKMMKGLPRCVLLDNQQTPEDLWFVVRHELDLYEEGEENDIRTKRNLNVIRGFLKKWAKYSGGCKDVPA
jgi:hypothetical protein